MATAISATIQIIILFTLLHRKLNITGHKHIFTSTIKTLIATFFMYITCWIMLKIMPASDGKLMIKSIRLLIPLTTALLAFFTISFLLKSEELKYLYASLRKKRE